MAHGNPHPRVLTASELLEQRDLDAWVRGVRSALWGLVVDVSVATVVFLVTVIGDLEWTSTYWVMLGLGLAKSVVQGVVAYLARKLIKPGNVKF